MRYALVVGLTVGMIDAAMGQPALKTGWDPSIIRFWQPWPNSEYIPADDLRTMGAYFKVKVLGAVKIWNKIETDPKVIEVYTKYSGVEVGGSDVRLVRGFELFLGRHPELVKTVKQLDGKWVEVEGDLRIVHGPIQCLFGSALENANRTEYAHPPPRYVIEVQRLGSARAGVPNANEGPYVKIEVKGIMSTWGKNPPLQEITDGKGWPSTVIRTDQCNLLLFLGKDDKWLPRAKELNRKLAVASGELISVGRDAPELKKQTKPFGVIPPLPFYLLDVSDLQPVPATAEQQKNK